MAILMLEGSIFEGRMSETVFNGKRGLMKQMIFLKLLVTRTREAVVRQSEEIGIELMSFNEIFLESFDVFSIFIHCRFFISKK